MARTTGEINTDFFSPAQEAGTRDDIPLHALSMMSTSPHDKDFLQRLEAIKSSHPDLPILFAGDERSLRLRKDHEKVNDILPERVITELTQLKDILQKR